MKAIFVFLLTIITLWVHAGEKVVVCGSYTSDKLIKIKIYEPVNSFYNTGFFSFEDPERYSVPGTDSFYFKTKINEAITLLVYITDSENNFISKSMLVLFPNDSVNLNLNFSNPENQSITYYGSNAEGQKLFNDIVYDPIVKYKSVLERLNKLNDNNQNLFEDVNESISILISGFDKLQKEHKISKAFEEYQKITFTQLLYEFVISKLLLNYPQREALSKQERDKFIASCYQELPVSSKFLKSSFNAVQYIISYYNYLVYKEKNLSSIEALFQPNIFTLNGSNVNIENECSQFLYIKQLPVVEELWGIFMVNLLHFVPDGVLSETIIKYKKLFPKSKWISILEKQEADCSKEKFDNYSLSSPIVYLDSMGNKINDSSNKFNSLVSILKLLPTNNAIFVDIWASWCGPCIKAFKFNHKLDSLLKSKGIEKLYISLDGKHHYQNWNEAIQKYKLGGFHVLADNNLIKDLKKVYNIMDKEGITIPRYILIGKNKEIVLLDAASPSEGSKLVQQINQYLK